MGASNDIKVKVEGGQVTTGETTVVSEKYADETLRIIEDHGGDFGPLTPEKEKLLRRKLYINVMGLLSAINLLLFVS